MPTTSVLLVEDSAADVYLIERAVKAYDPDLQLWVMPDGPEALAFLRKEPPLTAVPTPALIILDLRLPKMNGTEVLKEIRHLPLYQETPVVVLSVIPKEKKEAVCLNLGATAYVQKPSDFPASFDTVKALVQRWLRSASA